MAIYTIRKIKDAPEEEKVCCLCGKKLERWGNDPWPLAEDGECCDECNYKKVIPARIEMHRGHKEVADAEPKEELQTLIKSEEEAITLYKQALENSVNDNEKKLYQHILDEEIEHLEMLKNYLQTGEIKIL